jgi:hypothetical protein
MICQEEEPGKRGLVRHAWQRRQFHYLGRIREQPKFNWGTLGFGRRDPLEASRGSSIVPAIPVN